MNLKLNKILLDRIFALQKERADLDTKYVKSLKGDDFMLSNSYKEKLDNIDERIKLGEDLYTANGGVLH